MKYLLATPVELVSCPYLYSYESKRDCVVASSANWSRISMMHLTSYACTCLYYISRHESKQDCVATRAIASTVAQPGGVRVSAR